MLKPCPACRSRKVRCDGIRPTCGPCSRARKTVQCFYHEGDAPGTGSVAKNELLKKGAACAPCRLKKKKCDGQLPYCTTCKIAGKEDECQYNDGVHRSIKSELLEKIQALEQRLHQYEGSESSNSRLLATSSSVPSFLAEIAESPNVGILSHSSLTHGMQLPADFDFVSLRERFFTHCAHIGLCITVDSRTALKLGDTTVIHPAVLHAAQLWASAVPDNATSPYNAIVESIELQSTVESLNDAMLMMQPTASLQAHQIVSMYHFAKADAFKGREYLLKASHIVLQHNLRLVTIAETINRTGEICRHVTLQVDEQLGAICQLLCMDLSQGLTIGTPYIFPDNFIPEIKLMPTFYHSLSLDSFAVVARTVSVLYCHQSKELIANWEKDGCCTTRSSKWFQDFTSLIELIRLQNTYIDERMGQAMMMQDVHNARALKIAQLMALSALSDLHMVMAPTILEWRQSAVTTATQIVTLTSTFSEEDYIRLDPVLSLAWNSCINVLRFEASSSPMLIPERMVKEMFAVLKDKVANAQKNIACVDSMSLKQSLF